MDIIILKIKMENKTEWKKKDETKIEKDEYAEKPPKEEDKEETIIPKIEEAKLTAEMMRAENDRKEKLLEREEALQAEKILGGDSEAGTTTAPEMSDEEKASRARIKAVGDASGSAWAKNYE